MRLGLHTHTRSSAPQGGTQPLLLTSHPSLTDPSWFCVQDKSFLSPRKGSPHSHGTFTGSLVGRLKCQPVWPWAAQRRVGGTCWHALGRGGSDLAGPLSTEPGPALLSVWGPWKSDAVFQLDCARGWLWDTTEHNCHTRSTSSAWPRGPLQPERGALRTQPKPGPLRTGSVLPPTHLHSTKPATGGLAGASRFP